MPARVPREAACLARRARGRAGRGRTGEGRDEPAPRLRREEPQTRKLLEEAPKIGESLCEACVEHFAAVRADLDATGVQYELVPTLVRGLDYYSRTTWEFVGPMDNENSTISGGGRYDYLVEEIGGPSTPGVGFGAGIERLLIAMEDEGVADAEAPAVDVFLAVEPDAPRHLVPPLLKQLRESGIAADTDYAGRSLKGQLTQAGRSGAATTVIIRAEDALIRRPAHRTNLSPTRIFPADCPDDVAYPHVRRAQQGARRPGAHLVRLGGAPSRPRRPDLRRPPRPHRDRAARDQPRVAPEAAELAHQIRNEFVLRAEGTLVARSPETVNPNMPTGEVELQVDKLEIVSRSTPLPFQLDEENVDETLRLRYRWLDLRREKLQRNITLRAQMVGIIRREMEAAGFLDIQTPILFKPTPEGARDFVVPSRLQKGRFYALPQSPQILKQLTMVAGFDRYYQIAICFRDEDLRADRVQEITQLDVEMSFPDQEFLYDVMERMYARIWRECLGIEIATPFPRMTFEEADRRFGSDKPDTPLRARARGRDRDHPQLRVRRLQGRRCRAVPPRAAGALAAATWRSSRSSPRSGARRGSPTSCSTRRARCARRSRSFSPRKSWPSSAASRRPRCSSPPTAGPRPHACSVRCGSISAVSSA